MSLLDGAPTFGLYLHIPFCSALCPYCDFAVIVGRDEQHQPYLDALGREAAASDLRAHRGTVFIGGGTPSAVEPAALMRAMRATTEAVGLTDIIECTIETNPDSVDEARFTAWRAGGVDRVSLGAQSFDDDVLRALGRTHDAAAIERAVFAARAAGIANLSIDLIYGGPGESDASWRATLQRAIALEPDHLSAYALTIEDRTPFGTAVARGAMRAPDDDTLVQRFEHACEMLDAAGYHHYEISNWARPGAECAHNLVYWTQGDYLGLGLGAHSHRGGTRWWNARALMPYIAAPERARAGSESLDPAARADEWLSLRLRLLEPIDITDAQTRSGRTFDLDPLERAGLVARDGNTMRLTIRGMMLENAVTAHLLG